MIMHVYLNNLKAGNLRSQQHVNVPTNVVVNLSAMVHVTHAQKANLLVSD